MTATEERIMTRHPDPTRQGVHITRKRYDAMQRALLAVIPRRAPGVAFADLPDLVRDTDLDGGSITWYVVAVKLDLQARGRIARLPGRGPQRLIRTEAGS